MMSDKQLCHEGNATINGNLKFINYGNLVREIARWDSVRGNVIIHYSTFTVYRRNYNQNIFNSIYL